MGCLFAARLALTGIEVALVDIDRERIKVIDDQGLVLQDDAGTRNVAVRAATAREIEQPVDLLIVFTKGNHTRGAAESVAHDYAVSLDRLLQSLALLWSTRPIALTSR